MWSALKSLAPTWSAVALMLPWPWLLLINPHYTSHPASILTFLNHAFLELIGEKGKLQILKPFPRMSMWESVALISLIDIVIVMSGIGFSVFTLWVRRTNTLPRL